MYYITFIINLYSCVSADFTEPGITIPAHNFRMFEMQFRPSPRKIVRKKQDPQILLRLHADNQLSCERNLANIFFTAGMLITTSVIAPSTARYVKLYHRDHVTALKFSGAYSPKKMIPDSTAQM